MFHSEVQAHSNIPDIAVGLALWYDPERIVLGGSYSDQVTAYRARKRWIKALEMNFLLEAQHDFRLQVTFEPDSERYCVRCDFLTACGRYAFWRLTHNQAPDVQYMLETAHLPSLHGVGIPSNLQSDYEVESRLSSWGASEDVYQRSLLDRCAQWFGRLLRRLT